MALRFDVSGDALTRTTTLPTMTAFTFMAWIQRVGVGGGTYEAAAAYGDVTANYALYLRTSGVVRFALTDWAADYNGSAITDGVWYHLAMTVSGTGAGGLLGYRRGVLEITGNAATITGSTLRLCAPPAATAEWANMRMAAVKIYSAVLTANEIANEANYYRPIRAANLNTWLPMVHPVAASNAVDYSGVSANMTVGGTLTVEDGPPIEWAPRPTFPWNAPAAAGAFLIAQERSIMRRVYGRIHGRVN